MLAARFYSDMKRARRHEGTPSSTFNEVYVEILYPLADLTISDEYDQLPEDIIEMVKVGLKKKKEEALSRWPLLRDVPTEFIDGFTSHLTIGFKDQKGKKEHEDMWRPCDACGSKRLTQSCR